ncbi:MAG: hypothetical protein IPK99_04770 [Flavobacteriales bacterium]|nr:hypothetical protein [Flavobacteriales bacterium]
MVPFRLFVPWSALMLASFCFVPRTNAQYFRTTDYWKTHRNEISIGLGASNFLGELGGRDQVGTSFIWDLELSQTRPAFALAHRYYIRERFSLRTQLAYGVMAGNDNLTNEAARARRNLNFRSGPVRRGSSAGSSPVLGRTGAPL